MNWFINMRNKIGGEHKNSKPDMDRLMDGKDDGLQGIKEKRHEEPGDSGNRQEWLYANLGRFQHLQAEDIMIARASICAIPVGANWREVLDIMSKNPHSRYPIYTHDLDDTKGFVHVKDVFMRMASLIKDEESADANFDLQKLVRSVLFVSPSMMVDDLLFGMRKSKARMAMVVDEHGGVDGLVTLEDVLEEIVGDMSDEYDDDDQVMIAEKDGFVVADARVEIVELEQHYGPIVGGEMSQEDFDTLGGLMFFLAGRVPVVNEVILDNETGINFHILESDSRRIKRVKFRPNQTAQEKPQ